MRQPIAVLAALVVASISTVAFAHETHGRHATPAANAGDGQKPFGRPGDPAQAHRTIAVSMDDRMRYEPAVIRVREGETVKLVATNNGQVLHEIVLGTLAGLREHAELMRRFPGMEHEEPFMAHVNPAGREELVWQFNRPGEFFYGCLVPGHFEAGMVGKVVVEPR